MFNFKVLALSLFAAVLAAPTLAQEMRCGNHLIAGNQINPLLKEQVLEKCGEPTSKSQNRWYYQEHGKILVFSDNGELDHIQDANDSD